MLFRSIGKEGQNARLAAKLTGWRIDIRSDEVEQSEQGGSRTDGASSEGAGPAVRGGNG